ncbi:response regulator transcription factor [Aneurinibacillus sp. UBA3580]|jgi:DNA-binding response OmpR family regulator|uniref:response regulator transcription factor n=1 Tax=Aneurinibacillus sp. UBA3580 TaxID=1946041 RepID=UPI002580765D|nr:response regulator transcription factor [Aneurinibacillus sp. UBA3580]
MRILLAEDDRKLGNLIAHMLKKERYAVDWTMNGMEAYERSEAELYDLLILDWMMPGKDGISVCRDLRQEGYQGAILLLTARDSVDDRVCGLDAGADDYLVKPFDFAELFARIRSLLRRRQLPLAEEVIPIRDLLLNCNQRSVQRNGEDIQLTPREFQLLELLARNRGHIVPRDTILDRVWGYDAEVSSNTLDAFVRLLRKKIDRPGESTLIRNVRGIGYKLEV